MKILPIVISLLSICFVDAKSSVFQVVIDPGHGGKLVKGKNDGSQGSHGASHNNALVKGADGKVYYEKDLTLQYAKELRDELNKLSNIEVTLTREDDSSISAMMRAAIAVEKQADLFISLHFNAGGGKGPRAYVVAEDHPKWEYVHFVNPYIKRDIAISDYFVRTLESAFKPYGGKSSELRVFSDTHTPLRDHGIGKGHLKDGIRTIGYARMDSHLYNSVVMLLEVEFLNTKNYSEFLVGNYQDKVRKRSMLALAKAIDNYRKVQVKIEKPIKPVRWYQIPKFPKP